MAGPAGLDRVRATTGPGATRSAPPVGEPRVGEADGPGRPGRSVPGTVAAGADRDGRGAPVANPVRLVGRGVPRPSRGHPLPVLRRAPPRVRAGDPSRPLAGGQVVVARGNARPPARSGPD